MSSPPENDEKYVATLRHTITSLKATLAEVQEENKALRAKVTQQHTDMQRLLHYELSFQTEQTSRGQ